MPPCPRERIYHPFHGLELLPRIIPESSPKENSAVLLLLPMIIPDPGLGPFYDVNEFFGHLVISIGKLLP